jgi:NhaP-type Na+/H+ or K+/H+ antiporter
MSPEAKILFSILLTVISGGLGGAVIFQFLNWAQTFVKLSGPQQFAAAVAIAFVLPPAAYLATVALGFQAFDVSALVLAIFAGYVASQGLAYQQRRKEEAAAGSAPGE